MSKLLLVMLTQGCYYRLHVVSCLIRVQDLCQAHSLAHVLHYWQCTAAAVGVGHDMGRTRE